MAIISLGQPSITPDTTAIHSQWRTDKYEYPMFHRGIIVGIQGWNEMD